MSSSSKVVGETKSSPPSSCPSISFYTNTLPQSEHLPKTLFDKSKKLAIKGIARNKSNHHQGDPATCPICLCERVETWNLGQCADCKRDLGKIRLAEEMCEAEKVKEEDRIQAITQPHADRIHALGIHIDALVDFAYKHNCWKWPTWKIVRDIIVPATRHSRCRYADLPEVKSCFGPATVFMSHCWGSPFGDLIGAACHGASKNRIVWIDIFAVRQWPGNEADLDFRGVITRCAATIVAVSKVDQLTTFMPNKVQHVAFLTSDAGELAQKIMAFFRLWCIVELAAAIECGKPVLIKGGVAIKEEDGTYSYDTNGMKSMLDNLTHMIDCEASQCAVQADYVREMKRIRDMEGGVNKINSVVVGVLEGAQHSISANVPEVDAFVCGEPESLRSMGLDLRCQGQERNRLLEVIAVASGGGRVEVLNKLWMGWGLSSAFVGDENIGHEDIDIKETKTATMDVQKTKTRTKIYPSTASTSGTTLSASASTWICNLIDESKAVWIACKGGHIGVLKKLLNCPGVNINIVGSSGSTPLVMAKQGNHNDIIKILLENGATETSAKSDGNLIQSVIASMYGKGTDPFGESISRRIAELGEGFIGREWLAQLVVDELDGIDNATCNHQNESETKVHSSTSPRMVVVYGDSGTGKTAFMCRVLNRSFCIEQGGPWEKLNRRILARHMCTVNDSDSLDPVLWVRSLAGQIFEKIEAAGESKKVLSIGNYTKISTGKILLVNGDDTFNVSFGTGGDHSTSIRYDIQKDELTHLDLTKIVTDKKILKDGGQTFNINDEISAPQYHRDSLLTWLQAESSARNILDGLILPMLNIEGIEKILNELDTIWLDSLDEASTFGVLTGGSNNVDTVVSMLLQYRHKWPKWIKFVATSRPDEATRKKLQALSGAKIDVKDSHNLTDIKNYVTLKIGIEKKKVIDLICTSAAGVFMYASEVIRQYQEDQTISLDALPTGLAELYMDRYRRTFKDDYNLTAFSTHSKPMLAMLMSSRSSLPLDMVKDVGSGCGNTLDKNWSAARQNHLDFVQRMCVGSLVEVGLLQFSHRSFPEWLEANEKFQVDKKEGEILLGTLCLDIIQTQANRSNGGLSLSYSLKHVVSHLMKSERKNVARGLLLDISFLFSRANDIAALLRDFRDFKDDRVVTLVGRALGLSLNSLKNNPKSMPSQLIGRLLSDAKRQSEEEDENYTSEKDKEGETKRNNSPKKEEEKKGIVYDEDDGRLYFVCIDDNGVGCRNSPAMGDRCWGDMGPSNLECVVGTLTEDGKWICIVESNNKKQNGTFLPIAEGDEILFKRITTEMEWIALEKQKRKKSEIKKEREIQKKKEIQKNREIEKKVQKEIEKLLKNIRAHDFGFNWWCPTTMNVMEQANSPCLRKKLCHSKQVNSVAFSNDVRYVASGSDDTTVHIWSVESGESLYVLKGHTRPVNSVAFSLAGKEIVSGSQDNTVRIWSEETGECLHVLEGHSRPVNSVSFSHVSEGENICVVSGSYDTTVRIWTIKSGGIAEVKVLNGHSDFVLSVAFSMDDKHVVSGSSDCSLILWDVESEKAIKILTEFNNKEAASNLMAFYHMYNPENATQDNIEKMLIRYRGRQEKMFQKLFKKYNVLLTAQTQYKRPQEGHSDVIISVAFSSDGKNILSGSKNNIIHVWDVESGRTVQMVNLGRHATRQRKDISVMSLAFSPDGRSIVASCGANIYIWDIKSEKRIETLKGHEYQVRSVAFSSDGKRIVSGSMDKMIRVWDITFSTNIRKDTVMETQASNSSSRFSPDGKIVVTSEPVQVWDVALGAVVKHLRNNGRIYAFSPDGDQVSIDNGDGTIVICNVKTGEIVNEFDIGEGHNQPVTEAYFSDDGKKLISGGGYEDDISLRYHFDISSGETIYYEKLGRRRGNGKPFEKPVTGPLFCTEIDLSSFPLDNDTVGLDCGYVDIGSTGTLAAQGNRLFALYFGNGERRIAFETGRERDRQRQLGFDAKNPWSKEKEAEQKENKRRQQLGFSKENPWSLEKETEQKKRVAMRDNGLKLLSACNEEKVSIDVVKSLLLLDDIDTNIQDEKGQTPLLIACFSNNIDIAKTLLENKRIDPNLPDNDCLTPLIMACLSGNAAIVRLIIQHSNFKINNKQRTYKNGRKTSTMGSALAWACEDNKEQADVVKLLLSTEIDVNLRGEINFNGPECTAVWKACSKGYANIVELLLGVDGIDIHQKCSAGTTPFSVACGGAGKGNLKIVSLLLEFEGTGASSSFDLSSALSAASSVGNSDIVKLLLDVKDIDVNRWNGKLGCTPLFIACSCGNVETVELLLGTEAIKINQAQDDSRTPLFIACANSHKPVVRLLLSVEGIDIDQRVEIGKVVTTPLLNLIKTPKKNKSTWNSDRKKTNEENEALRKSNQEIIHLLINAGAKISLHEAVLFNNMDVVTQCLRKNEINVNQVDKTGKTALFIALKKGYDAIIKLLFDAGAKISLHDAVLFNRLDCVERCLKDEKVDLNRILDEDTALLIALENGYDDISKHLLDAGAEISLHDAVLYNQLDAVERYLNKADVNAGKVNGQLHSSLVLACQKGFTEIVKILLSVKHLEVNQITNTGSSLLFIACEKGYTEIVQLLLKVKGIQVNQPIHREPSLLFVACQKGHTEIVQQLLNVQGIKLNQPNNAGCTPFWVACAGNHYNIVKILLQVEGIDQYKGSLRNGTTPFFTACENCCCEVVKLLVGDKNIDINQIIDGRTPLLKVLQVILIRRKNNQLAMKIVHILIHQPNIDLESALVFLENLVTSIHQHYRPKEYRACKELIQQLIEVGACKKEVQDEEPETIKERQDAAKPLYTACKEGDVDLVKSLLSNTINVNQTQHNGWTPLLSTATLKKQTRTQILKMLLNVEGIDVNQSINGYSALTLACQEGFCDVVEILLEVDGIDVNKATDSQSSPLAIACQNKHTKVVQRLVNVEGIDLNKEDEEGETPLEIASKYKNSEILLLLANAGAKMSLHDAVSYNHLESVERWLNKDQINVNEADSVGRSALFVACQNGNIEVVNLFLCVDGLYINQQEKDGKTSLWEACSNGHTEIVQLLLNVEGIGVNQANNHGVTPFFVACEKNYINIVNMLVVTKGIDINKGHQKTDEDKKGITNTFQEQDKDKKRTQRNHTSPIKEALRKNNQEIAHLLINAGVEISSLHQAVLFNDLDIVTQCLRKNGINVNKVDKTGKTALSIALENGCDAISKNLFDAGAEISLHDAVLYNQHATKARFKSGGEYVKCKILKKDTENDLYDVEFLSGYSRNRNNVPSCEMYVTDHWSGLDAVKRCLKDTNNDVNEISDAGNTPLGIACENGYTKIVQVFLGVDGIDVNRSNIEGCTPLYVACTKNYGEIIQLLLNVDSIDINQANNTGFTPLANLIRNRTNFDATEVINNAKLLLDQTDVDVNQSRNSPLSFTCGYDLDQGDTVGIELVKLLLNTKDIDINCKQIYDGGVTPLSALSSASKRGQFEKVKLLVNMEGIDKNDFNIAFEFACLQGHLEIIHFFLQQPSINVNNKCDKLSILEKIMALPWFKAIRPPETELKIVKLLISTGALLPSDQLPAGEEKESAIEKERIYFFFLAIKNGNAEEMKRLIELGVDVNTVTDKNGENALVVAYPTLDAVYKHSCLDIISTLIPYFSDDLLHKKNKKNKYGKKIVFKKNKHDNDGSYYKSGNRCHCIICLAKRNRGRTFDCDNSALGKKISNSELFSQQNKIMELLLNQMPEGDAKEKAIEEEKTDKKYAEHKYQELLDKNLFYFLGDHDLQNQFGTHGRKDLKEVKKLIALGADVNQSSHSILCCASESGHSDLVKILIEAGGDVNQSDKDEITPLYMASQHGHVQVVKVLLAAKDINVNQPDDEGTTPLWIASRNGNTNIVSMLLASNGIKYNQPNNDSQTPLNKASQKGNTEIVRLLLQQPNIVLDTIDDWNTTALGIAIENKHTTIIQLLKDAGATYTIKEAVAANDINYVQKWITNDKEKDINEINDVLIAACQTSHIDIVVLLLNVVGIDVNHSDEDECTSIMYASVDGYTEVVRLLLQQPDIDINKVADDGDSALIVATREGHTEIIQLLKDAGATYTIKEAVAANDINATKNKKICFDK